MEPQSQPVNPNPQPTIEPAKKCKHMPIIIILAILAIGGLGFGGYELWQNIQKDDEIKNLQVENIKVEELKEEKENENMEKDVTKYYFEDNSIPGGSYYVEINYDTKSLFVKEENYCSAVDCQSSQSRIEENTVTLNNDEITKIQQILAADFDESSLGGALSSLAKKDEIMDSKDDHEEKYWLAIYARNDLNMDGIITYREFGNAWLDIILEGKK